MSIRFEDWEKKYFQNILNLFEIFEYYFHDKLDVNFNSSQLFNKFSLFLFDNSYKEKIFNLTDNVDEEYERYRENLGTE